MLWEDTFYENGMEITNRIAETIKRVDPALVAAIAIEARHAMKLRHVPLFIAREMARLPKHKAYVAGVLASVIERPDELTEFLAIYWKDKRQPLSSQVKKGLAKAFKKFNAYQLAKYNRDNSVKLRDVLFLTHPKPLDAKQEEVWKKLVDGTLESPDTWEVNLSAGKDKKETFERLIMEKKLGGLALLRNLRNMTEAKVDQSLVADAIRNMKVERVLPFRFITAARYAPNLESPLEEAMLKAIDGLEKLKGSTLLVIDVSGSMDAPVSAKTEVTGIDAACGLAILARELSEDVAIYSFSTRAASIPPRRGFALRDAIERSQPHGGTNLWTSLEAIQENEKGLREFDRVIVVTDEQSHDSRMVSTFKDVPNKYIVNVRTYRNGVGYGEWNHIDGFSEATIAYITEFEKVSESKAPVRDALDFVREDEEAQEENLE
jgi:hypothetical protein